MTATAPTGALPRRPVFHIALAREWAAAQKRGSYDRSTRGMTLVDVGFIHCAFAPQIAPTLERFYTDCDEDLVLLRIDPARTEAEWRIEPAPGTAQNFPHLYGPLPLGAVLARYALPRRPDGSLLVPAAVIGD